MKAKKLLALFLTALMALTILTACGGGSNKLDMDDVNAKVVSMGGDAVVENDGRLNSAVRAVANEFRRRSTYSPAAANDIMVDLLPNLTWRLSTAVLTELTAARPSRSRLRAVSPSRRPTATAMSTTPAP